MYYNDYINIQNINRFRSELRDTSWNHCVTANSNDNAYNKFLEVFHSKLLACFPLKRVNVKKTVKNNYCGLQQVCVSRARKNANFMKFQKYVGLPIVLFLGLTLPSINVQIPDIQILVIIQIPLDIWMICRFWFHLIRTWKVEQLKILSMLSLTVAFIELELFKQNFHEHSVTSSLTELDCLWFLQGWSSRS